MSPVWKQALVYLALTSGIPPAAAVAAAEAPVRRFVAEDVTGRSGRPDAACLIMAAAIAFDAGRVYVADAEDCAVKVFSKTGRFEATIGRKGQGPGEFSFPSGVSVLGTRLFVADKLNRRIQVVDVSGRFVRSFDVPFAPDRVFVLAADVVLVTYHPGGRSAGEKMLHLYSATGEPLRQELAARFTGDPVFDVFLNMFVVNPGSRGDFFVIFKSQEKAILHYARDASLLARIPVDRRYDLKALPLPVRGARKTIEAFCWDSAHDRGRFYLLAPEYTETGDIGPGDKVFVFDAAGHLEARVDLPARMTRLAVDGDRIYAVDREGEFKVLRIAR
jgi:DNA-binding beta-propeller fold protein YncE